MKRFLIFALVLGSLGLAQKDPHPCYLMGIFNPNNTPNALGSVGFVMSNEGLLQDGKPLSGPGGQAVAQAMAQSIGSVQPMYYCIHNLSGGVVQLQYFRSSPEGAKDWLGKIRKGAPSWVGLQVGDEAGLFRGDQSQPGFNLAFRYREYAFLLTNSSVNDPESYRKWALAVIERVQKFK